MPVPSFFDGVNSHMAEMTNSLRGEFRKLAPSAPGTRDRSTQEQAAIFKEISRLPEAEMRDFFGDMKARAGHSEMEQAPCEFCSMIAKFGLGVE